MLIEIYDEHFKRCIPLAPKIIGFGKMWTIPEVVHVEDVFRLYDSLRKQSTLVISFIFFDIWNLGMSLGKLMKDKIEVVLPSVFFLEKVKWLSG